MNKTLIVGLAFIASGYAFLYVAGKMHMAFEPNRDNYTMPNGESSFDDGDMPNSLGLIGLILFLIGLGLTATKLWEIVIG